jgi:DegV family protein with EDD domain
LISLHLFFSRRRIVPEVVIITDTDASLPKKVSDQYGIRQVPIAINFGSEVFQSGVDIDDRMLFDRVDKERQLPTTSAPSPGDFSDAFAEALRSEAESILCFCVSSEISATYGAAVSARQTMPDRDIHIIDTRSLSMGQGFMVLAAAEAAQSGASIPEIKSLVESVRERTYFYAVLPTLKYLAMSGRVRQVAAGLANVISIKPILTINDGKLDLLERVRTLRKAWRRAIELSVNAVGSGKIERLAIVHARAETVDCLFTQALGWLEQLL